MQIRVGSFLEQNPVFQVSRVARRSEALLNSVFRSEGLSFLESLVLAAIFFEKKGTAQPSSLAEAFQMTRGNISHCISSLEAKGLVQRRIDPNDARAIQLSLLPLGRRRAARVAGILDRVQKYFEAAMGAAQHRAALDHLHAIEDICGRLADSTARQRSG
ncbi:MarR family winged helix-turn-helix transcriptional regulator [Silvibacterium acidisoli]|uniref:MarR family winged helix-turn-helix transcriptional regulator n=1 Tax=Acidobacteriaceae bacterium ZG23-2 TaxID=2883246 RepID=UPI00406D1682